MKYIYALAQTKQYETLKSMILNLADCFRYLTYDNEKMVPLQKELEHVEHYLTCLLYTSIKSRKIESTNIAAIKIEIASAVVAMIM